VLSQTLSQLRATSTRDSAGWKTNTEHDDEMEKLQSQNFDLVKRINDQESRLRILEADVTALEKEVSSIDEDDVESQEEMDKDA
jgi:cob(I)alamin adenosyltransferase